jgi:steroid delta-isomerase-like uncharacterized protein
LEEVPMSQKSIIEAAKAPVLAFNEKDWEAVKAAVTEDFVYDEVATERRPQGIDAVLEVWQGWGTALPDTKATFHSEVVSGNTVVFEVTWQGTHSGPLVTPGGEIPPTGRRTSLRACQVFEVADGKARVMRQYFDLATLMKQLGVGS